MRPVFYCKILEVQKPQVIRSSSIFHTSSKDQCSSASSTNVNFRYKHSTTDISTKAVFQDDVNTPWVTMCWTDLHSPFWRKENNSSFLLTVLSLLSFIKLYLILFLTFKCLVIYHNWCTSNIGKQLKFDMVFMFEKMYQSCVDLRSCGQLRPQIITRRKLYVFAIFLLPIIFCNFKLNSSETLLFGLCSWSWCLSMKTPDDHYIITTCLLSTSLWIIRIFYISYISDLFIKIFSADFAFLNLCWH